MRRWRWEIALGVCLVLLAAYKLRDLNLPFFWDELGVYGPSAFYLHDHHLGLMPVDLPPELSRGHPLVLPFVYGALFRVFGAAPVVAHAFTLLLALALVASTFHVGRAHFGSPVGLAAAALLAVQPIFLAQSTLLLPELPVALTTLWTLHAFATERRVLTAVCATLGVLLKETALVLPFVLGLIQLARWLRARPSLREAARALAPLVAPAVVLGLFLLVQKRQNGWFFFPLHRAFVRFTWASISHRLKLFLPFLFYEQGRVALSVAVLLGAALRLVARNAPRRASAELLGPASIFAIAFLLFSSVNFPMNRYLLCLVPLLTLMAARALFALLRRRPGALAAATLPLMLFHLLFVSGGRFNYDYDMSFREAVLAQRAATRWVEDHLGHDAAIYAPFPLVNGLEDPRYGYARGRFTRSMRRYRPGAQYIFAAEFIYAFAMPPGVKVALLKTFRTPTMTARLYRVTP